MALGKLWRFGLFFTRLYTQFILSSLIASLVYWNIRIIEHSNTSDPILTSSNFVGAMGIIGGMLALVASVSFGFILHFVSDATTRKQQAYYVLQKRLYELDSFLRDCPSNFPVVREAKEISFNLKTLRLQDLPFTDWGERIDALLQLFQTEEPEDYPNLHKEIAIRIAYCEQLLSDIGLMSIKQITAEVVKRPVIKVVGLLIALILTTMGTIVLALNGYEEPIIFLPFFFGTFSALLFLEMILQINREIKEETDFHEG